MVSGEIAGFVRPARVFSRDDVLAHPSPVPSRDGVYGWWFRRLPPFVVASGCYRHQDLTLLYAGMPGASADVRDTPAQDPAYRPARPSPAARSTSSASSDGVSWSKLRFLPLSRDLRQ
jgi:hypothetical protein